MGKLIERVDEIARDWQHRRVEQVATQLRTLFGNAAVEVKEARVLVRGKDVIKRWLIDPSLRFLPEGWK